MTPGRDAKKELPLVLVKLGGSVLTRKSTLGGIRHENLVRLARELTEAASNVRLVLVHGGGSVGHPLARMYHIYGRVDRPEGRHGDREWRSEGASVIQRNMLRLNAALVGALMDGGLPALSVPGGVLVELRDGKLVAFHPGSIERYLENGLIPVTFGDVAPDQERGLAIVSGDTLMLALARALKPDRVVFATDQDGVYASDPGADADAKLVERLDAKEARNLAARFKRDAKRQNGVQESSSGEATDEPNKAKTTDATGGMVVKLEELAEIVEAGMQACVVSGLKAGRLAAAVQGKPVRGTRFEPSASEVKHAR